MTEVPATTSSLPELHLISRHRYSPERFVIQLLVPARSKFVREEVVSIGAARKKCIKFTRGVDGGHVCIYAHPIHNGINTLWNREITASVTLWVETISDGRMFLALHAIQSSEAATHGMKVVASNQGQLPGRYTRPTVRTFRVLDPLVGWVVFTPR